ncbi:MAG: MmcQ/YjbR family DNA-binding protein [Planctomycetota bacterium]
MTDRLERLHAAAYALPGVDVGESCVNRAYRVGGKAFGYLGDKPDQLRLMVKLGPSLDEAQALAKARPAVFEVGKSGWVTVRLPHAEKVEKGLLERWIAESHAGFAGAGRAKPTPGAAATAKKTAKK